MNILINGKHKVSVKQLSEINHKLYEKLTTEQRELYLCAENNYSELYETREIPIMKNLGKKIDKGIFDFEKSKILWKYWVDDVNKKYKEDFGYSFSVSDRKAVAEIKASSFLSDYLEGNLLI